MTDQTQKLMNTIIESINKVIKDSVLPQFAEVKANNDASTHKLAFELSKLSERLNVIESLIAGQKKTISRTTKPTVAVDGTPLPTSGPKLQNKMIFFKNLYKSNTNDAMTFKEEILTDNLRTWMANDPTVREKKDANKPLAEANFLWLFTKNADGGRTDDVSKQQEAKTLLEHITSKFEEAKQREATPGVQQTVEPRSPPS